MRRLIFLRHGQYDELDTGALTPLGRKQATRTATALRRLNVSLIWTSSLLRARQTTELIGARHANVRVRISHVLCEVIPTKLPRRIAERMHVEKGRVEIDRARADRAFTMLFRPSRGDRTELVVCHGNLIRYLVCCALGIERKLWTKLDSTHCGLTEFRVLDDGAVRVVRYNDVGHMPFKMRTASLAAAPPRSPPARPLLAHGHVKDK